MTLDSFKSFTASVTPQSFFVEVYNVAQNVSKLATGEISFSSLSLKLTGWFECRFVGNLEERVSRDETQFIYAICYDFYSVQMHYYYSIGLED